jgi:hypothetical protein
MHLSRRAAPRPTLTWRVMPRRALQDVIEQRHTGAIRGELLGWQAFAVTLASIVGPPALGLLMPISPANGAVVFTACSALSAAAAAIYAYAATTARRPLHASVS